MGNLTPLISRWTNNSHRLASAARMITLGAVASLVLVACGSADQETQSKADKQASAGAVVCPPQGSKNVAFKATNRLDTPVIFKASSINCSQWSERGNPSVLDGAVIAAGKGIETQGLEPARSVSPVFLAWIQDQSTMAPIAHVEVKASGDSGTPADAEIRELIVIRKALTGKEEPWSTSSVQQTKGFGKRVRVDAFFATGSPPVWNLTFSYAP